MINNLTPEQEADLPLFRQRYLDISTNGVPANEPTLSLALGELYKLAGYETPPKLIMFDSPYQCNIAITLMKNGFKDLIRNPKSLPIESDEKLVPIIARLTSATEEYIRDVLVSNARSILVGKKIWNNNYFSGSQDNYWIAYYKFAEKIGCKYNKSDSYKLDLFARISAECEWWWPFDGLVIASQKALVHWDGEGRIHNEKGLAVEYRDAYGLCFWRGTLIPNEWIMDKMPPVETLMHWNNIEQRRAGCEILGWDNVLPKLQDARMINKHNNPQVGELWEAFLPDHGKERFLKVQCGTGRTFVIPVGIEFDTAREANAATYGISPQILDNIQFRT